MVSSSGSPRRLALVGYGKLGRLVAELAPGLGFEVVATIRSADNVAGAGLTAAALGGAEVAIELTHPDAALMNLQALINLGIPTVVGTTGWYERMPDAQRMVEKGTVPVVWGANFSVGMAIFTRLVREAGRMFASRPEYGAYAQEMHHAAKKDAPSGTLVRLLDGLRDAGYDRTVDVAHHRVGYIPGTHEFGFDSLADTVTLRHTARSREGFAHGALVAAQWLLRTPPPRKNLYEFGEIILQDT